MKSKTLWIILPIVSVTTLAALWFVLMPRMGSMQDMDSMPGMDTGTAMTNGVAQTTAERQPLYWVAPMDANYRRSEPGLSPMGMPLIPVYEASDTITVSASIQQNLGVRTAEVRREDFSPAIRAVGYTAWDESSLQVLHTRAEGWIEVFNLASVGDTVHAGNVLYELFAPNLVSAQREYLTARSSTNGQLTNVARDRLLALGFTASQVDQLDNMGRIENRLVVRAATDAIVTAIGVREGNYVTPTTVLASLASLDQVWIDTEVFESLAGWIEPGLPATVTFAAFPGESWQTTIAYVYPNMDAQSRSLRLRLVLANADGRLRPNMYANVSIAGKPLRDVLTVPREAVIRAGGGDRVILALGEGRFRPQVVQTGVASGERIAITSGLNAGDTVVTSGQFLLDSEANGEQALARLTAADGDMPMGGAMGSMNMANMNMASNTLDAGAQDTGSTAQASADDGTETFETTGEIRQIVPGTSVTIAHQPVAALGWPAMVMAFQLAPQLDISSLNLGDAVTFTFQITPEGAYQLVRIATQGGNQ